MGTIDIMNSGLILYSGTGVRAQVATIEQASTNAAQNVDAPVVVVTGASRGIGKAIALALGKAGCKVSPQSIFGYKYSQRCITLVGS